MNATARLWGVPSFVLLSSVCAGDDLADSVRESATEIQTEVSRKELQVVFGPIAAGPTTAIACEYAIVDQGTERCYIQFLPGPDGVRARRVILRTSERAKNAGSGSGCQIEEAHLSTEDYERLLRSVVLVRGLAVEKRQAGRVAAARPALRLLVGEVHVCIGETEYSAVFPVPTTKGIIETAIDDRARAVIMNRMLQQTLRAVSFRPLPDTGDVANTLREVLRADVGAVAGWRRDVRVAMLGWMGGPDDIRLLRGLDPPSEVTARAILQLETLSNARHATEGVATLLEMVNAEDAVAREWATAMAKTRFPREYGETLARVFKRSPDPSARHEALNKYLALPDHDRALCEAALADPVAGIRVDAAVDIGAYAVVVQIAQDKGLEGPRDVWARVSAIMALTSPFPAPRPAEEIGPMLVRVMRDADDDVRVRRAAAEGVGRIGYDGAVPALIATAKERAPLEPRFLGEEDKGLDLLTATYSARYDIRVGAIQALGLLRAGEIAPQLRKMLGEAAAGKSSVDAPDVRAAAEALARIGDVSSLQLLEQAAARATDRSARASWERTVRLLRAIASGDGRGIMANVGESERAFVVRLLSDVVSRESLEALAATYRREGDARERLVAHALELVR